MLTHPQDNGTTTSPPPLALFGALGVTFDLLHDAMDQWGQSSWAACNKGLHGEHLVNRDGRRATEATENEPMMTASQLGRLAVTQHVLHYTAGQIIGALTVTRALGYRMPLPALAAGALINGVTHWVIDRREPLYAAARMFGKGGYLHHATVVRKPDTAPELTGPGTASFELDKSAHRVIGLLATVVTVGLAVRFGGRR